MTCGQYYNTWGACYTLQVADGAGTGAEAAAAEGGGSCFHSACEVLPRSKRTGGGREHADARAAKGAKRTREHTSAAAAAAAAAAAGSDGDGVCVGAKSGGEEHDIQSSCLTVRPAAMMTLLRTRGGGGGGGGGGGSGGGGGGGGGLCKV